MAEIKIEISQHSQRLIENYQLACDIPPHAPSLSSSSIDFKTLLSLLTDEQILPVPKSKKLKQNSEMILVSLRAELLHDLFCSMEEKVIKIDKNTKGKSKAKFALISVAGILVAACEGFDGVVTLLSVFTLPSIFILAAGFICSIFSIAVFCIFDLVKISSTLGIKLNDSYQLLDAYLFQLKQIKAIRKKIDEYSLAELSQNKLEQLEQMLFMLQKRVQSLAEASQKFDEALNSTKIQMAKNVMTGISALLFFGGGFFAGQSVALFIAGMVISTASPVFWPVLIFSVLVGLAALSHYWYVERPELTTLVSDWFGLNEERVTQLCDKKLLEKEEKKLVQLNKKVINTAQLTSKITQLEQRFIGERKDVDEVTQAAKHKVEIQVSTTIFSFLSPPSLLKLSAIGDQNSNESIGYSPA